MRNYILVCLPFTHSRKPFNKYSDQIAIYSFQIKKKTTRKESVKPSLTLAGENKLIKHCLFQERHNISPPTCLCDEVFEQLIQMKLLKCYK